MTAVLPTRRGLLTAFPVTLILLRHPKPMTTYIPCAGSPISLAASADKTGRNTGNLTNAFTTNVLGTMPPIWEWFHAVITTSTPGGIFTPASCGIYADQSRPVGFTFPAGGSEYDPNQPIQFRQGNELYFFWNLASSTTPVPVVTLYLRYDADIPANQSFRAGA